MSLGDSKVDTTRMEELYQEIATEINMIIPEQWSEVLLYSEVEEHSDATFFYYYPMGKTTPIYSLDIEDIEGVDVEEVDNGLSNLSDLLRKLWNEFIVNKQEPWKSLNFILNSEGKFNIQYSYEDLEKDGYDYVDRVAIWEYEKLNMLPKSTDVSGIELIENYKKKSSKGK
ncbi:immunity protein YezG family protein [Listeria grandensis]|uniref:immunity protein YezG family protein n=1 Tax=Listeria grandensis TaxID=1494963 RepID=UPI001C89F460|nr:immunity protein YezG family protein [Listeria grandensis]